MKKNIISLVYIVLILHIYADDYNFPDPYPEVYEKVELLPYFVHGWNLYNDVFDPILAENKIKTVFEIGVFLGKFSLYFASHLPFGSRYFAIDHWKGSEEHFVAGTIENQCLTNFYQQFLSNVIHAGLTDVIIPVRMSSLKAAKKFKELNIKADLIYLDAAHDYISVIQDLYAWYPLLEKNGIYCGDDWHYGGVRLAVQHFAEKKGLKIITYGNFWKFENTNTTP